MLLETDCDESEIDALQTEYYGIHENYQQYITKMRSVLSKITPVTVTTTQATSASVAASMLPKLPNINLPTFSGDLIEYEEFIDQFEAQIGSRPDLEPLTKLQYLKSLLKGRALELIKGYSSTSANYISAINTLKETYGDEERIKHCLFQKMASIESPKHNKLEIESFRIKMLSLTPKTRGRLVFPSRQLGTFGEKLTK